MKQAEITTILAVHEERLNGHDKDIEKLGVIVEAIPKLETGMALLNSNLRTYAIVIGAVQSIVTTLAFLYTGGDPAQLLAFVKGMFSISNAI